MTVAADEQGGLGAVAGDEPRRSAAATHGFSRRDAVKFLGVAGVAGVGASRVARAQEDGVEGWRAARNAVVRIVAVGEYDLPDVGEWEGASSGSGFLIDPSGVAVTNNHVVTGASRLRAFVGENELQSFSVTVLGQSECADLAVVRLLGSGFPSLTLRESPVRIGEPVWSHGFDFGRTRMSTETGIVNELSVDGHTAWASVEAALEHSATTTFGSSGGPLVDANGAVVGVNFAGNLAGESFSIPTVSTVTDGPRPPNALDLIESLRAGENSEYFGLSTVAFEAPGPLPPDGLARALHVVSVDTGSPGDAVGLEPGDVILQVENVPAVDPDGPVPTKRAYCGTLTTAAGDPVAIQVLGTGPGGAVVVKEGAINGQPLEVVEQIGGGGDGDGEAAYDAFRRVPEGGGVISAEAPTAWGDVRSAVTEIGPALAVAPDVDGFLNTWSVPGALVFATDGLDTTDPDEVLDGEAIGECGAPTRTDFANAQFTGRLERFDGCPGGASTVNVAAVPADGSYLVFATIRLVAARDEAAAARFLDTLAVEGFVGTGGDRGAGDDGADRGAGDDDNGTDGGGDDGSASLSTARELATAPLSRR